MIRRIPAPLAALLAATALLVMAWAYVSPPFQSPDEFAHVAYTTDIAEKGVLPDGPGSAYTTELGLGVTASRANETARSVFADPQWSRAAYDRWRARVARLPGKDRSNGTGGDNPAAYNPPLYYLFEAIPYRVGYSGDLFARLYLMRIWSGLLLLASVVGTWLLVGELVGRRRGLQLVGASVMALEPMATFVSSSVNPDAALAALSAFAAWLGVKVLRAGPTKGTAAALMGVLAAAVLTKATAFALLPAGAFALAFGWWRTLEPVDGGRLKRRLPSSRAFLARWTLPLSVGVVPVGAWLVYGRLAGRSAVNQLPTGGMGEPVSLFSYLWQFYLPQLPGQYPLRNAPSIPAFDQWIKGGWAAFGWLEVKFPTPVYYPILAFVLIVIVSAVVVLVRRRRTVDWAIPAFFVILVGVLLAGLHYTDYSYVRSLGQFNTQGRYLLPAVPLLGASLAYVLSAVRATRAQVLGAAVMGGLVVLQVASLGLEMSRYYAA